MLMTKAELSPIIKEVYSSKWYKDLETKLGISALMNRDYEGEIKTWADTVKIPYIVSDTDAEILTSDNQPYNDGETEVGNKELKIEKKVVKSLKITDWAKYISNPGYQDEVRHKLEYKALKKIEETLIAGISPTVATSGVAALTIGHFTAARKTLNDAEVPDDGQRVVIVDSNYMKDLLDENEMISKDYIADGGASPLISGYIKNNLYGFKIFETNLLGTDNAYFWHPSFMTVAMQKGIDYKEMDLEPSTKVNSVRVRVEALFDYLQMDANRVTRIYNT